MSQPPPGPSTPQWYYNVWFVLFMLFVVLGPFGLPLVWKHPKFSRNVKWALTAAMVLYTIALIDLVFRIPRMITEITAQFAPLL